MTSKTPIEKTLHILNSYRLKCSSSKRNLLTRVDLGIQRDGKKVDSGRFYIDARGLIHSHGREGWDKEIEGKTIIEFLKSSYHKQSDEDISKKTGLPIEEIKRGFKLTKEESKKVEEERKEEKRGYDLEMEVLQLALGSYKKKNQKNQTFYKKRGFSNKLLEEYEEELFEVDTKKLEEEIDIILGSKEKMSVLKKRYGTEYGPESLEGLSKAITPNKIRNYSRYIKVKATEDDKSPTYLIRAKDKVKGPKYTQIGRQKTRVLDKGDNLLIVVEGQMDYYTMKELEINGAFSSKPSYLVSFNASNQSINRETIKGIVSGKKNIIFVTDNDEAGRGLKDDIIRHIGEEANIYDLMNGTKYNDVNEMLQKEGLSGLRKHVVAQKGKEIRRVSTQQTEEEEVDFIVGELCVEKESHGKNKSFVVQKRDGKKVKVTDEGTIELLKLNLIEYDYQLSYEQPVQKEIGKYRKGTTKEEFKKVLREKFDKKMKEMGVISSSGEYKELLERIEEELRIIISKDDNSQKNYFDYFLNASEIEDEFRKAGIITDKRGTASAFLMTTILEIIPRTKEELFRDLRDKEIIKERFLSQERVGDPDIDWEIPRTIEIDKRVSQIQKSFGMKRGVTKTTTAQGIRYSQHVSKFHFTGDTRGGIIGRDSRDLENGDYQNLDFLSYPGVLNKIQEGYESSKFEDPAEFILELRKKSKEVKISLLDIISNNNMELPHLTEGALDIIRQKKKATKGLPWVETVWVKGEDGKNRQYLRNQATKGSRDSEHKWISAMNGQTIDSKDMLSSIKIYKKPILDAVGIMNQNSNFDLDILLKPWEKKRLLEIEVSDEELYSAVALNRPVGYLNRYQLKGEEQNNYFILSQDNESYILSSIKGDKIRVRREEIEDRPYWGKKEVTTEDGKKLIFSSAVDRYLKGEEVQTTQESVMENIRVILEQNGDFNFGSITEVVDNVRKFISKSDTKIDDKLRLKIGILVSELDEVLGKKGQLTKEEKIYEESVRGMLMNSPFLNNKPHNIHLVDQIKAVFLIQRENGGFEQPQKMKSPIKSNKGPRI